MNPDEKFLLEVVKAIVEFPDQIKIARKVDEMGVLLTLTVAQSDMGRIVGRSGNTANALRTLLRVVGMAHESRVNMKISEPEPQINYPTDEINNDDFGG